MCTKNQAVIRSLDEKLVGRAASRLASVLGAYSCQDVIEGLASAAVRSPAWSLLPDPTLIVKSGPPATFAFVGEFGAADRARIDAYFIHLEHVLRTVRHVTYAVAESDVELLARRLRCDVGEEFLSEAVFAAIPRGGLVVLGMLAGVLDIPRDRVATSIPGTQDAGRPVVLIDDCVLTGLRLREHLGAERPTVVAHLYSHPDLRAQVEREPGVVSCVAAKDLVDHAAEGLRAREQRNERWSDVVGRRYWYGLPDYVTFAWKEPDSQIWNPVTQRMEGGWLTMPPALCLSNRRRLAPPGAVQLQPTGPGPLRTSGTAFFGWIDGALVVGDASTGRMVSLDAVAAQMWEAIVGGGSESAAVTTLAARYDAPEDLLRDDVGSFVRAMRERNLLELET